MYFPRALGVSLVALSICAALYQIHTPIWTYLLLLTCGLGWPHVAYLSASRSRTPITAEYRNLKMDAAFGGFWLSMIGFNLAPGILMVAMLSMTNAMVGGIRLLVQSIIALALAAALTTIFGGVHFDLLSNQATRIACAPFLLVYPVVVGILIGKSRNREARDKARAHHRAAEARLSTLLATSPTVLYALEHDGLAWRCVEITSNLQRLLGYRSEEALTSGWRDRHIHPEDYIGTKEEFARVLRGERVVHHYRMAHMSGGYRWLRDELELLPPTEDRPMRITGAWLDVTEKQQAEADTHRLAFFDTLTGLANRHFLHEPLTKSFDAAQQSGSSGALLLIDLNCFKTINDVHGHSVGDQVLVETGRRLLDSLCTDSTVARIGSDEFVVLLPTLRCKQEMAATRALEIAKRLSASFDKEMSISDLQLHITVNIGISIFPNQSGLVEDILREADIALHTAKATRKSRVSSDDQSNVVVFEAKMQDRITELHHIQNEIRTAISDSRIELWLQRQVDFKKKVVGAEALIRLRRADGSLIFPGEFIPIAEETGLIVSIGRWVRTEACRLLASVDVSQLPRLSINVSVIEFRQPRFADEILSVLAQEGVDPSRLTLEITESLLIDQIDDTISTLKQLTAHGIRISIDDFGTGYSSLAYLQRLPLNEIKIDKRFVHEMLVDVRSARLTQSLIMLAKNMGVDVIAEGVETREQEEFLVLHGCDHMQGFLFGRPEPHGSMVPPLPNA